MARDTKTDTIFTSQSSIDFEEIFGWKVKSKKMNNNGECEKVIYERDNNIPNYEKIVELERQYHGIEWKSNPYLEPSFVPVVSIIIFIIGIIVLIFSGLNPLALKVGIGIAIFGLLLFVIQLAKYKNKMKAYKSIDESIKMHGLPPILWTRS